MTFTAGVQLNGTPSPLGLLLKYGCSAPLLCSTDHILNHAVCSGYLVNGETGAMTFTFLWIVRRSNCCGTERASKMRPSTWDRAFLQAHMEVSTNKKYVWELGT